jgi:hypothetical protein
VVKMQRLGMRTLTHAAHDALVYRTRLGNSCACVQFGRRAEVMLSYTNGIILIHVKTAYHGTPFATHE